MAKAAGRTKVEIQAGDLRLPLLLFTRTDTQSTSGGSVRTLTPMFGGAVLWASDKFLRTHQFDQAGKLITSIYHVFTVHYNAAITSGMYLRDPNFANLMYIQGVTDPNGDRHWMQLDCTDVEG